MMSSERSCRDGARGTASLPYLDFDLGIRVSATKVEIWGTQVTGDFGTFGGQDTFPLTVKAATA